ncbi:MAG: hypothetical protein KDK36_12845 [Leptospiraceae bacterium]|nr:hypothetical protein [Leptospiraceae bacterium]
MANITIGRSRDLSNIKSHIPISVLDQNKPSLKEPPERQDSPPALKTIILVLMVITSMVGVGIYSKNHSLNETYFFSGILGLFIGAYSLFIVKGDK